MDLTRGAYSVRGATHIIEEPHKKSEAMDTRLEM
jgi:hypothetical protein